jgi:tetratricopeptide (TPR) repeat protein
VSEVLLWCAREAEERIERSAQREIVATRAWAYQALGRAYLLLGDVQTATLFGKRAAETAASSQGFLAHAHHLLASIAIHPGGMRPLIAHCHRGLSTVYRRIGKRAQAREHLTVATTMYREMDMTFWLAQVEEEMRA